MVTVYRFSLYDIDNDQMRQSLRWATREAIERINAHIHEETAVEIPSSDLDGDQMTARSYNPHSVFRGGFQTKIVY